MSNNIIRLIICIIVLVVCMRTAFFDTPDLDDVENRFIYRFSYTIVLIKGMTVLLFDLLNLFPIE